MQSRYFLIPLTLLFVTVLASPVIANDTFVGTWSGKLANEAGFQWQTELFIGMEGDKLHARVSFPDWAMFRLETTAIEVEANQIQFKILWMQADLVGTLDGESLNVRLSHRSEATGQLTRTDTKSNFFKRHPFVLKTADRQTLSGTIIFPHGDPPFPGMVLTHGSGPDTRTTAPYISKAHLAAENGLAVLIYDKRGAGESSGDRFNVLDQLCVDALGMVDLLKKHPDINRKFVGVGGISQGAWVAPKVAYDDPEVAFVFTVATPGISPAEQNVYSLETRIESEPERAFAKRALRTLYEFYRTNDQAIRAQAIKYINNDRFDLRNNKMFVRLMFSEDGQVPEEVDPGFWAKAMFDDPLVWWSEIDVPVASFSGLSDNNVPPVLSKKLIEAALQDAENTQYEFFLFPNAGHGLTLTAQKKGDWPRSAPGYVDAMRDWFQKMSQLNGGEEKTN